MDWLLQELRAAYYVGLVIVVFAIGLLFYGFVESTIDRFYKIFKKGDDHE